MDEKKTPYLFKSGLKLDFDKLKKASDFSGEVRLDEETTFLNGMMRELVKNLGDFLSNNMFFMFIKSIVPISVLNDDRFPKDRQIFIGTKLNLFKQKVKDVQKTKSKLVDFLDVNLTSEKVEVNAKVEILENELIEKNEEIDCLEARLALLKKKERH